MILRYEFEIRSVLTLERATEIRALRVESEESWRGVGEECVKRWDLDFGRRDQQALGATLCHVAAELLGEDPDAEPWN